MKESLELSIKLNETAEQLYKDWLDTKAHSCFTGSPAKIDASVKGRFTAWDGYISGTNIKLEPFKRIVQSWRTTEFDEKDQDSTLEIHFEAIGNKTILTLKHKNIPEGQGDDYRKGWMEFYFNPMKAYYNNK
jgi:activator of HSP90 ATPase